VKLKQLTHWTEGRRSAWLRYHDLLTETTVKIPRVSYAGQRPSILVVRHPTARRRIKKASGLQTALAALHYPLPPPPLQKWYAPLVVKKGLPIRQCGERDEQRNVELPTLSRT